MEQIFSAFPGERHSLLGEMSEQGLNLLTTSATFRKFKQGEFLLREGSLCSKMYLIEKGILRHFYNKDGKEINLNFSFRGTFVTNLKSLQTGNASEIYIQAEEDSAVWEFGKQKLLDLYAQSPEIMSFGRKLLEQLLADQEEHANFFKIYTPFERYNYIVEHQPHLLQQVSLSKISSYLGISRETLSRIRGKR